MSHIKRSVTSFLCCLLISLMPIFHSGSSLAQSPGDLSQIKERLVRLEEGQKALAMKVEELDKRLSGRIEGLDQKLSGRIEGLEKRIDYVVNLIYVVLGGMFALVGFVLWNRRSALAPAIRRTQDLEDREQRLERAIKEFALKNPEMKEILKSLGLL